MTSTLSTEFGSSAFCISDVVQNLSSQPAEVEMLYHCNIGEPFLGEGSVYHGVASEVAPRDARAAEGISMWNLFERPVAGYAEQVYFSSAVSDESGLGIGLLCDATGNHAFCVRFDTSTLPWMALWKNTQDTPDGYVTGLEPASSFPNPRMFEREQGRVIRLAPGGEVRFQLTFEVATEATRVRQLVDEVTTRQVAVSRIVHERPRPGWSP